MFEFFRFVLLCSVVGSVLSCVVCGTDLHDNSPDCDCYVTDGSSSAYYSYHRFFDFRNFQDPSGLYDHEPANVTNAQYLGDEPSQLGFLNSSDFEKDWKINSWGRNASASAPVAMQNSRQNVWIQTNQDNSSNTHLALRTHRNANFSSTAEIENLQKNLFHASIRIHARVYGAPGGVAGMFTYLNDSTESDIEILTRDPTNLVRYTNQPSAVDGRDVPQAETDPTLPDGVVWTDWNTHRLDWTPDISAWYVNNIFVANKSYGVPQLPSILVLNMWSNGGSWSQNMTIGAAAYLEIQWIDMVFNTSGPTTGYLTEDEKRSLSTRSSGCKTVCAVDGIQQVGFPEIVSKSTSAASGLVQTSMCLCVAAFCLSLVILDIWV